MAHIGLSLLLLPRVRETASKVRLGAAELMEVQLQVIELYDAKMFSFH